ncbi:MAG TPA: DUF3536 domain-containing protein [Thermoanaerobaculaceae bacterium]|nr:DUF3536 domain-containing protein [Thermoanaerobaculaceae bacterium]
MGRFVCIHGHFYQPPRENPWLETIEVQDSAEPYHDWNERVAAECYAPNAASRILDGAGTIVDIVNNYSRISFDFGPTLLAWLETARPDVYRAVLDADRASAARFGGHGSALAQAYNHVILPLANRRDKATQVRWGLRDFEHRFRRSAEGMWLPETAVDVETLEALAAEGVRFTVLAPHQARRVRAIGEKGWREVAGGSVDPTVAYRVALPSGAAIAVFFYDGPISRAVAFERLLASGEAFAGRLLAAVPDPRGRDALVHIATDGETYGHHHRFGDMALAWALHALEANPQARLTNYAGFLAGHPPRHEAEIVADSSWSCGHGVERWRSDCGCATGAHPGWRQAWRGPLRAALDWLRDALATLFEARSDGLLADPWAARDAYVDVVLDRSAESVDRFLAAHGARPLAPAEQVTALKLLEMQRHAMLMYTSCGWFFDDVSGIETVQVLQYAGRALELGQEFTGEPLEARLLALLARAPSNLAEHGAADAIFRKLVQPARAGLARIAAQEALAGSFGGGGRSPAHRVECTEQRRLAAGRASLRLGRLAARSEITRESAEFAFAVLHIGDHNVSGGVLPFPGEEAFRAVVAEVEAAFGRGDVAAVLRVLDQRFDGACSLASLFPDEQRRILRTILEATLDEAAAVIRQLYDRHAPLMRYLEGIGAPLPRPFLATAEFVLNTELRRALRAPELDAGRIRALVREAEQAKVALRTASLAFRLQRTLARLGEMLLRDPDRPAALAALIEGVELARWLPFEVDLWQAQNAYFALPAEVVSRRQHEVEAGDAEAREWLVRYERLGGLLRVRPR